MQQSANPIGCKDPMGNSGLRCGEASGEVRIVLDLDACTGCGNCYSFAPATFIVTEDLKVALTGRCDAVEDLKQAADACPVDAIDLHTGDGTPL
jgi:ferredoxin